MAYVEQARSWARGQAAPITIGLIGSLIVTFLISWFTHGALLEPLALTNTAFFHPWGFVTYLWADPGDGNGLFWFLLLLLWFYWVGTSIEREIGTRKYAALFAIMTVLPAVLIFLGGLAIGKSVALYGSNLAISGLTVAWGIRNAKAIVRLWMILPVTGLVIAILTVVLVLFGYGTGAPLMGVIACGHLLFAYLFATNRIPKFAYSAPVYEYKPSKEKQKRDAAYIEEISRREAERAERERLRRLFEKSGIDDPEK